MPQMQSEAVAASATSRRTLDDLPQPRGRLPLVGHALLLRDATTAHLTYERWARELGDLFVIDLPPGERMLAVADGACIQEILKARPDTFRRWARQEEIFQEVSSVIDGVFLAEGESWKRQRKLVNAALNARNLERYFDDVRVAGERLHRCLEAAANGEPYDITRLLYRYTVDVTSALALGHDLNTLERGEAPLQRGLELMFETVMKRLYVPVPYWRWLPLRSTRELKRVMAETEREFHRYLERGRRRMHARPELADQPENALDAMLAAQMSDPTVTDHEILSNINTLLTAGEDTTANTLAWTTWFLASRPELQDRLAAEARDAFGDARFPASYSVTDELQFADHVLRESTRLRSVAPLLALEAVTDTVVAGVAVPRGTVVGLLTRHAADGHSADSASFAPERWADPARTPPRTLAFGGGPRFCPGRNLALAEAKAALAMLCRDFEFTLDESSPVVERLHFTLVPEGLRLRLRPRTRDASTAQVAGRVA